MDTEKPLRKELIDALGADFECFEEINLSPALLPELAVRADVLAVTEYGGANIALAFEVKKVDNPLDASVWAHAVAQASHYVGAVVNDPKINFSEKVRVNSAFIFPAPEYVHRFEHVPELSDEEKSAVIRTSGVFRLGVELRVGNAYWSGKGQHKKLILSFANNNVWNSSNGFLPMGNGLMKTVRRFGSSNRRIDLFAALDKRDARL